jgi:acyl-coenzyme A synthetase/AMP-(fatty) acid ligase
VASDISSRSLAVHIKSTQEARATGELPELKYIVVLEKSSQIMGRSGSRSYKDFLNVSGDVSIDELRDAEKDVKDEDVVNVQFTSGTTGLPKAALLTHRSVPLSPRPYIL